MDDAGMKRTLLSFGLLLLFDGKADMCQTDEEMLSSAAAIAPYHPSSRLKIVIVESGSSWRSRDCLVLNV